MTTFFLQWATPTAHPAHMARLADLERDGWRVVGRDWRWPSWLMRKDAEDEQ